MKLTFLFLLLILSWNIFVQEGFSAGWYPEVSCSSYGLQANSCNQCFDGWFVYNGYGRAPLYDDFLNTTSLKQIILASENTQPVLFENLQPSLTWTYSKNPLFHFSQTFSTPSASLITKYPVLNGTSFYTFQPNSTTRYVETDAGDGFYLANVSSWANRSQPGFKLTYNVNYRTLLADGTLQNPVSHNECVFYKPAFCGDAILDSGKETCDPADATKTGWGAGGCNTSCQPIPVIPTPSCDAVSANPVSGTTPLVSQITCNGSNLPANPTYSIICGNGTNAIMSGNKGTCTYTNTSTVAQAFTPICTINGTITWPSCQTVVSVNPPVLAACVPGTTTGPQVAALSATSPNLCPATQIVGGFTGTTVGTLTNYTWSCNGSTVGGACAASYNSATNIPILSIKKYANTADGQIVSDALSLTAGSSFNYRYDVTNSGNVAALGVVVTDTLPQYTTLGTVTAPAGWTCNTGTKTVATITYPTVVCTTASLAPNTTVSITVGATLAAVIPTNTELRNIVYTCKTGDTPNANCTPGCIDPNNPACTPPPPPPNCNPIPGNPNYDPACIIITTPTTNVSIKKYAKSIATGDTESAPISIAQGETFSYFYQIQNTGAVAATGVVVKDTLPPYLTFTGNITITNPSGIDVTNDWIISTGSQLFGTETIPRIYLILTKKTDLPANSGIYTFNIPVKMANNTPVSVSMQNIAYVCAANMVAKPTGPGGELICGTPNPPPPPPPFQCTPTNNPLKDPACIIVLTPGFDLSLKKYIGTNDAQSAISTTNGAVLSYILRVTNSGTMASSGITTVQDILPTGVEYDTAASGSGWTCSVTTRTLRCTSTQIVASWSSYPDITVPFRVTATANQTVTNIAAVDNPNETNRCNASGLLPSIDTASCTGDTTNSDPAVLSIPGGSTGGTSNVGKKCVNGVATCATYNSIIACEAEIGVGKCYSSDSAGVLLCQNQPLICDSSCSTPGSCGPGGPSCTWPGCYSIGYCGDGVLQNGEECDVQWLNGTIGAFCSASCKITNLTNPGANPITDLWMTIPVLAWTQQKLGYSWLDGIQWRVAFNDNRMVLGVGTKAFTLADTVGFGIKTQYRVPIMIEADKKTCLQSTGNSLNSEIICTSFGDASALSSNVHVFTRYDGKKYVVIGNGDYQYQTGPLSAFYVNSLQTNSNSINLFKGPVQYQMPNGNAGPTLNSAFFARNIGTDGVISLLGCSGSDCSTSSVVNLVSLPVRVSSAAVSSIGSSSNRSLETFLNPGNLFTGFLWSTKWYTSTTNSNNNTTVNNNVPLPTIHGIVANPTVTTISELETYAVNGNKNVLAVNGNLTISCSPGRSIFEMSGVRTVIVTGNLIIKCNLTYASNDNTASWAWITKGGNIQVYNGTGTLSDGAITNIAGVFVSVKEGVNGGNITYTGNTTTQTILRVEGTLYGNATPLFNSRLYARATSAYDILTTGTILNYSNRALVSPPPLLSQYLRNYQVQRVVQ